jgi:putative peptide zinc metalloprotease protein
VTAVAAGALLLPAAPAYAQGDTTAVAINTKDGFDLFRLAFQVRRTTADVVDTGNAAVAYASCTDCQTVALAIQVLLISGYDSSTVAPENLAIAINESCVACETLASAYQFVLTAEGMLHFTADGSRALAELRQALLGLKGSDLPVEEIQAKLDALMDDLAAVLATELVPAGESGTGGASPTAAPSASASPSAPADGTTAAPPETPTAEPSATGESSADPSESAAAEPSATP